MNGNGNGEERERSGTGTVRNRNGQERKRERSGTERGTPRERKNYSIQSVIISKNFRRKINKPTGLFQDHKYFEKNKDNSLKFS